MKINHEGIAYQINSHSDVQKTWAFVLIPGYSASSATWPLTFIDKISQLADVVLIDNRGTGQSVSFEVEKKYSVRDFASDVLSVLKEQTYSQYILVGHSLGGCIALDLAHSVPALTKGLVLVSTTGGGTSYVNPPLEMIGALANPPGDTLYERTLAIWKLCLSGASLQAHKHEIDRQFEVVSKAPVSSRTLRVQLDAYRRFDFSKQIFQTDFPVAIVHGASDRLTPMANAQMLQKLIPKASLTILPGCEHVPYLEQEDEFVSLLKRVMGL